MWAFALHPQNQSCSVSDSKALAPAVLPAFEPVNNRCEKGWVQPWISEEDEESD